jgi:hypothetical protein|tara:strand:+ start:3740 stop:4084 length:345 start_codon:yes stop_codon:yes gene_type:complete
MPRPKQYKRERVLIKQIKIALNALPNCKAIKLHGSAWQEAGTPDILCVREGKPYLLECKINYKNSRGATPLQQKRIREWCEAGATSTVVWSLHEAINIIRRPGEYFNDKGEKIS